jgi:AraC family transcriptional regulator
MSEQPTTSASQQSLGGGQFYGAIQRKNESCRVIFTDLVHTAPRQLPLHAHQLAFFALVLQGQYGERYARTHKQFGPFSLMYRPAGIPHQDEIGPRGVRFFEMELRPDWQASIADCSGNLSDPSDDERGGELLWHALKIYRFTRSSALPDELCLESLLAEMVALVARLPRETASQPPGWLSKIMDRLNSEYCRHLTLAEVSADAGVHPVHLSRVFRRFVGEGICDYVHRLRIREACRRMLLPQNSMSAISMDTGFADQSHFTRAFRKFTGATPTAFRAALKN